MRLALAGFYAVKFDLSPPVLLWPGKGAVRPRIFGWGKLREDQAYRKKR